MSVTVMRYIPISRFRYIQRICFRLGFPLLETRVASKTCVCSFSRSLFTASSPSSLRILFLSCLSTARSIRQRSSSS